MARRPGSEPCPCGSGLDFSACCQPCLSGSAPATQAEQLMRSRYCAYVKGNLPYLLATWHPRTRPATLEPDPPGVMKWLGLTILDRSERGDQAEVEFIARAKVSGRAINIHERSSFTKEADGHWYYVDGIVDR